MVSAILPLDCAIEAMSCPRSPSRRACSRSSVVTRVNWTSCFAHSSRTPSQFLLDPLDLPVLGGDLRGEAADLFLRLQYALGKLRLQSLARLSPDLEQRRLAGENVANLRIVPCARAGRRGKSTLVFALELGFLARAARRQLVQPLDHDREIGAGLGIVEPDDDVADVDDVAVAHAQFGNDAAGRVLHLLDVGVDDELALRDHRAGKLAGRGPAADAADQQHDNHQADQEMAPDRLRAGS